MTSDFKLQKYALGNSGGTLWRNPEPLTSHQAARQPFVDSALKHDGAIAVRNAPDVSEDQRAPIAYLQFGAPPLCMPRPADLAVV